MAGHYNSKFSGAQIDEAVEKVLFGTGVENGLIVLECSESSKINLNDVTALKTYSIAYYTNSYDDNSNLSPIILTVTKVDDGILEQRYPIGDISVHRFFNSASATFSDWEICENMASNLISVYGNTKVTVKQPTLVLRKVNTSTNTGSSNTSGGTNQTATVTSLVVNSIPNVVDAEPNVVYFVPREEDSGNSGNNKYDEYMLINGSIELIGMSSDELEEVTDDDILDILES